MLMTIMSCHGENTIFSLKPSSMIFFQWQNHNYTITMNGNLCLIAQ